eukprot:2687335-Rhodomonas_salina.1
MLRLRYALSGPDIDDVAASMTSASTATSPARGQAQGALSSLGASNTGSYSAFRGLQAGINRPESGASAR